MTKLNQQARNHREDATKILSAEAQDMDSNHDILLEVPPDGYHTTNNLRWVRSAAQGGTVLAQQYQSPIEREERLSGASYGMDCQIPIQPLRVQRKQLETQQHVCLNLSRCWILESQQKQPLIGPTE